jgi:hypothetical protein
MGVWVDRRRKNRKKKRKNLTVSGALLPQANKAGSDI